MSQQRLSKQQIAQLARQAGWSEDKIPFVVGVAGAESGFNPKALNPNVSTGDESYGLMQINMLGAMGPERLKAFGLKSKEQLYDPLTNLKAAKKIYEWQGPSAWSVYKSGKYKDYMPGAGEISQGATATQPSPVPQAKPKTTDEKELLKAMLFDQMMKQSQTSQGPLQTLYKGLSQPGNLFQGLLNQFMSGAPLGLFK